MARRADPTIILDRTEPATLTADITRPHISHVLPIDEGTRGRCSRRGFLAALTVGVGALAAGMAVRYARGLAGMVRGGAVKLGELSPRFGWVIVAALSKRLSQNQVADISHRLGAGKVLELLEGCSIHPLRPMGQPGKYRFDVPVEINYPTSLHAVLPKSELQKFDWPSELNVSMGSIFERRGDDS